MTATTLSSTTGRATGKPIPHGTVTGRKYHKCTCLPCYNAAAAYEQRRRRRLGAGVWAPFVDIEPVRAHIEDLHDQGMAYEHIATAAGLRREHLDRIRCAIPSRAAEQRVRHETAARILAVRYQVEQLPNTAYVPATGALRRVQALRALGWPVHELARRCGVSYRTLVMIRRQRVVYAATYQAIALLFEDLRDQDPIRHGVTKRSAHRLRRECRAAGFAPPLAWDDIDNDLAPGPAPWKFGFAKPDQSDIGAALMDDVRELADLGIPRDQIAARVGRTWNTITTAFNRAGLSVPQPRGSENEPP